MWGPEPSLPAMPSSPSFMLGFIGRNIFARLCCHIVTPEGLLPCVLNLRRYPSPCTSCTTPPRMAPAPTR